MSTWKSAKEGAQGTAADAVTEQASAGLTKVSEPSKVKALKLELDLDAEPGGDPYNCTGQHLLEAIRQYED